MFGFPPLFQLPKGVARQRRLRHQKCIFLRNNVHNILNLLGHSTDRYRLCNSTPNAATVAVTTDRVSLLPCTALWRIKIKNTIFGTQ